jgi:hypothetical protein
MENGQFREFASAVIRHLPDDLDKKTVQSWIKNPERLQEFLSALRQKPKSLLVSSAREPLLSLHDAYDIFIGPHNSCKFWKTQEGLYVSSKFSDRILSVAMMPITERKRMSLKSWDILDHASDRQIMAKLPTSHVFNDASSFCAILENMIMNQTNGNKGNLLTDRHNLFYVMGCIKGIGEYYGLFVVRAIWNVINEEWSIDALRPSTDFWMAGGRVFSLTPLSQ